MTAFLERFLVKMRVAGGKTEAMRQGSGSIGAIGDPDSVQIPIK
jgi:hypothetical protein